MDLNSIGLIKATNQKNTNLPQNNQKKVEKEEKKQLDPGVVFEKSSEVPVTGDYSNIVKENQATSEGKLSEIEALKLELDHQMQGAFYLMVNDVMKGQNLGMKAAIENLLEEHADKITPEMVEEAKANVDEGGFFSVESVTERIMDFAKALSGGDTSKISLLRDAFEEGFKEATKAWGDELPQISQDTYDSVMKAFDEWENGPLEPEGPETQETPENNDSSIKE